MLGHFHQDVIRHNQKHKEKRLTGVEEQYRGCPPVEQLDSGCR